MASFSMFTTFVNVCFALPTYTGRGGTSGMSCPMGNGVRGSCLLLARDAGRRVPAVLGRRIQ